MQDIITKTNNGGATSAGRLTAEEYNDIQLDIENSVIRSGQTLDAANTVQLGRAMFLNAVAGMSCIDSGSANAIVLTPTTGPNGYVMAQTYTQLDGAQMLFKVAATATGATTVNIGQTGGTLLGVKSLVDIFNAAIESGAFVANDLLQIQYSQSLDAWILVSNHTKLATSSTTPLAQCYFAKSGSNVLLTPYDGNQLTINGKNYTIPAAGVALAPAGLTPDTVYYIYAYMSGATMTLEASITSHSVDAVTGISHKTGDVTRTLVGLVRPGAGPAFIDTINNRLVISRYNRKNKRAEITLGAITQTTSNFPVELNSVYRGLFLSWFDDQVQCGAVANGYVITSTDRVIAGGVHVDGIPIVYAISVSLSAALGTTMSTPSVAAELSEGVHYFGVAAATNSGTISSFASNQSVAYVNVIG